MRRADFKITGLSRSRLRRLRPVPARSQPLVWIISAVLVLSVTHRYRSAVGTITPAAGERSATATQAGQPVFRLSMAAYLFDATSSLPKPAAGIYFSLLNADGKPLGNRQLLDAQTELEVETRDLIVVADIGRYFPEYGCSNPIREAIRIENTAARFAIYLKPNTYDDDATVSWGGPDCTGVTQLED